MLHIHLYVKKKAIDHWVVDAQEPDELACYTSHTCTKNNQINLRIRAQKPSIKNMFYLNKTQTANVKKMCKCFYHNTIHWTIHLQRIFLSKYWKTIKLQWATGFLAAFFIYTILYIFHREPMPVIK